MNILADSISTILGGKNTLHRDITDIKDFESIIEKGLPINSAVSLANAGGFTIEEVLSNLGISKSTYARKRRDSANDEAQRLELPASDRLFRIAYVIAKAQEVFGEKEKAVQWLHSNNHALEGRTPFNSLTTGVGEKRVEALLTALAWGDPMI